MAAIAQSDPEGSWTEATFAGELALAWSRSLVLIAPEQPNVVLGFLVYWVVAGEVQLHNVAVHAEQRRRGYGRFLMRELLRLAALEGAGSVELEVRGDNRAAIALYDGLGFVAEGTRAGYYQSSGGDAVLMRLALPHGAPAR